MIYEDKEVTEILQPLDQHNTSCFFEFTTRLVCSENVLHTSTPSSRAEFFTSTSLSKGFDNSLCALMFLIEISEKTKGNNLSLECLSNILNPYVIFRFDYIDLALLLVLIRITYHCIDDDRYTEAGCSGHLCY